MGKLETTPEANLDHQQPLSSDDPDAAPSLPPAPHFHTATSFPAHDDHQQPQHMEQEPPQPPTAEPRTNDHHVPHVTPPPAVNTDKTPAVTFPPQTSDSHAPPSSNQPVQLAPETANVRKQQPQLENGIDSIPAVAFLPQPRMQVVEPPRPNDQLVVYATPLPEANKMEGGVANALVVVTRQESGQAHLILIQAVGNSWRSGLFDCYQHPISGYVTGATLYFYLFFAINHWNIGVRYRRRVRDAYQLAEMPLTDRLVRLVSGVQRA